MPPQRQRPAVVEDEIPQIQPHLARHQQQDSGLGEPQYRPMRPQVVPQRDGQRAKVDAMLQSYYDHGLTDQRIKDTIDAYRKSEPHDVVNEMHSIFGTEVANLPGPLEVYYKQYFTDRTKVAAYTAAYQGEFTSRQTQVAQYDTQLKGLEQQIKANETQLEIDKKSLATQNQQLDSERSSGQIAAYNSGVQSYNRAVDSYNRRLTDTKNLISQYNTIVEQRNNIALEEQQLAQELSASSLPKN